MTAVAIDGLRRSLEGIVASILSTCDAEGTPNVSMISQVHYVDRERVALSYQFFNKTRRNLLATRVACVQIFDPETFAQHRLDLEYEETQTSGPIFETMRAKLAGIASHHGMEKVFRLLGADIFRIRRIEEVETALPCIEPPPRPLLPAARRTTAALTSCQDFEDLVDTAISRLASEFDISHAMLMVVEPGSDRLYAVASHGYPTSGIGAEVAFGEGVIGVAARENTPIRIGHMTREYRYGAAVSATAQRAGLLAEGCNSIPFPGLSAPRSQIAVPLTEEGKVIGVVFAEAEETMRFTYEDEDALALVAMHLASRMSLLRLLAEDEKPALTGPEPAASGQISVRYYASDQSVFIGNDYLIKGVAGAILWHLLREHEQTGRTEFTTRELRLNPCLRLPAHSENLDARLILLRRRLEDRKAAIRIDRAGRGRFRLVHDCLVKLVPVDPAGAD